MSENDDYHFGSLEMTENRLEMIMDKATLNRLSMYSDIFIYASEDGGFIDTICNQAADQAVSYSSFQSNVDVEGEFQALFNIADFYNIFNLVRGSGSVTLDFYGEEDSEIPAYYNIRSELEGTVYVQSSETDLENVSKGVTSMFNEEEDFDPENTDITTRIVTDVSAPQKIVDAYENESFDISNYPLVVEDGEFYLSLSDENERNTASGTLPTEEVEGEDVKNEYDGEGPFDSIFRSLSGTVEIQTSDGTAMVVVQESGADGKEDVYRHMLMPVN